MIPRQIRSEEIFTVRMVIQIWLPPSPSGLVPIGSRSPNIRELD
jgi:hypothetical protein